MAYPVVRTVVFVSTVSLMASAAAAQTKSPCDWLTQEEVVAVIGAGSPRDKTAVSEDSCIWGGKGRQLTVTRGTDVDEEQRDQHFRSQGLMLSGGSRDEKGLGEMARAYINTTGDQVTLSVARGRTIWDVTLHQSAKGLQLEAEVPKLRALAEKLLKQ